MEGQRGAVSRSNGKEGFPTLFQDDNRRCLAPERHFETGWAVGMFWRVVTELQARLQAEKRVCGGVLVSGVNALAGPRCFQKNIEACRPPSCKLARSLQQKHGPAEKAESRGIPSSNHICGALQTKDNVRQLQLTTNEAS